MFQGKGLFIYWLLITIALFLALCVRLTLFTPGIIIRLEWIGISLFIVLILLPFFDNINIPGFQLSRTPEQDGKEQFGPASRESFPEESPDWQRDIEAMKPEPSQEESDVITDVETTQLKAAQYDIISELERLYETRLPERREKGSASVDVMLSALLGHNVLTSPVANLVKTIDAQLHTEEHLTSDQVHILRDDAANLAKVLAYI